MAVNLKPRPASWDWMPWGDMCLLGWHTMVVMTSAPITLRLPLEQYMGRSPGSFIQSLDVWPGVLPMKAPTDIIPCIMFSGRLKGTTVIGIGMDISKRDRGLCTYPYNPRK